MPTLIEASWPENIIGVKPTIYPSEEVHLRKAGKCKGVKKAVATDIDSSGRLWLIDEGHDICSAKLVVWDLLYFNSEVMEFLLKCQTHVPQFQIHFQAFGGLRGKQFSKIVVDPANLENGDSRAYISLKNEDFLLVYSLNERKLAKLKFTNPEIQNPTKKPSFAEMVWNRQNVNEA